MPWALLPIRAIASPTVVVGETWTGVSKTGWAAFTRSMDFFTKSVGMSCGRTAIAPRRATVSAILRPLIAVMFATTRGRGDPTPSVEVRSTSIRLVTDERFGAMKTSL